ncbi:MAG: zinc metallopeptidase [Verrucomicrobia bacterium]|nr:zinc metallopeptidase [Verrucomicrobiota bacterium]
MITPLAFAFLPPGAFMVLFVLVFILAIYAQFRVSSAYRKNAEIPSRGQITGREAAQAVMSNAGITDVEIVETEGHLTDHYDPMHKRLVLSAENYHGTSLAALGVAAHEAGHAIQHKEGYAMLNFRMLLVPATQIVSGVLPFIILASWFLVRGFTGVILDVAIICYAVLSLFQLVTLPVEFDASRRAKVQLVNLGILDRDEMPGVNETLNAAALTYVAAFVSALLNLLYLLSRRD